MSSPVAKGTPVPAPGRAPGRIARFAGRALTRWRRARERLRPLGGLSEGNVVSVFADGDAAFESLLEAIDGARRRVWAEIYILEPDGLGSRVVAALTRAAARECEVILLYDAFGSPRAGDELLEPLRFAGARAIPFNPVWRGLWGPLSPVNRNHRKTVIVDDAVAFCGGLNFSDDYGGERLGNGRMRDTLARIEGPGANDLAAIFLSSLEDATGERRTLPPRSGTRPGGVAVQVLASNGRRNVRSIQKALRQTLHTGSQRCYLTTPYFVPPGHLKRAILRAARRGVDVRILTAGVSDQPLVRLASEHLYGRFLQFGVRLYEYFGRTLHAKTGVIDGVYAMVGSYNLDRWSDRRALEVNVTFFDPGIAGELEAQFARDLAASREITLTAWRARAWWRRLLGWLLYRILRW